MRALVMWGASLTFNGPYATSGRQLRCVAGHVVKCAAASSSCLHPGHLVVFAVFS